MLRLRTRSPLRVRDECAVPGAPKDAGDNWRQPTRSNSAAARDEPAALGLSGILGRDGAASAASDDGSVPVVVT